MKILAAVYAFFLFCFPLHAADIKTEKSPILRLSVLASGKVFLEGKESSIPDIRKALEKTKANKGAVWYYRENGKGEPPPQAMEVIKLIVEYKLPISMSSKPDFSDYINENGQSRPRK